MAAQMGQTFSNGLITYLGFLISITFYQAIVANIARKKGDNSTLTQVMSSFTPFVHMEIFGTVIFPLLTIITGSPVVFGWPKPYDIDSRYFRNPRRDINIIYICGIGIVFFVSLICMFALKFLGGGISIVPLGGESMSLTFILQTFLSTIGRVCMTMGALFLLPLPGTGGWYLLLNNVAYKTQQKLVEQSMVISIVGLFLIMLGFLNFYFKIFLFLFFMGSSPF